MVKKSDLLIDLQGFLDFEESAVKELADFYDGLNRQNKLSQQTKTDIESKLNILKKDTTKHMGLIADMIKYIEDSGKNEF